MADDELTPAELELLRLISRGFTSKEVAARQRVSERTIKARLSRVFRKLGVDNRAEAVMRASNAAT